MITKAIVRRGEYYDSLTLMRVSQQLSTLPGVLDAAVMMATEANKALFRAAGLLTAEIEAAGPNDLAIAFKAPDNAIDAVIQQLETILRSRSETLQTAGMGAFSPKTIRSAVRMQPAANIAVISTPGQYAADEAWNALQLGLHVLLFSDNVSLEDEITLKRAARQADLLMMGPGAGSAIINGIGLGFANQVPRGPVGIISAAGTGLQEVSCLLAKHGIGVSQAIGTGGRDLSEPVGGLTMLQALGALQQDTDTQVIVLISKPPGENISRQVIERAATSQKPTVVCFLGADPTGTPQSPNIILAGTLRACAYMAAREAGADLPVLEGMLAEEKRVHREIAMSNLPPLNSDQKFLRGLFSGGTLCYEAQLIWRERLSAPVHSNAPLHASDCLPDSARSSGHTALDLGEEEFTIGRPHPMINNDLRIRRLQQEAHDPQTAVIMLDLVLGYGAHPDPASELALAIEIARSSAGEDGRELVFIASVTGTDGDPQDLDRQVRTLEDAGVLICDSNASAAHLAAEIVRGLN